MDEMTLRARATTTQAWERAEIARSSIEATLTPSAALRVGPRIIDRYGAPPADTPFPLEYAYHLLGAVEGSTILDFGCGSGANTVLLAHRGATVCGVDISADLVALAKRRLEASGRKDEASFVVGSAHDLPLPDASIDVVFGIAILHHLDLALVSREVRRVLKPGGRAIFQEPVRNSRVLAWLRQLVPYHPPDVSPFERPLRDDELRTFAQGFRSYRARAFGLPHVQVGQVIPALKRVVPALYRSDGALLDRVPWLARFASVRVLELTK